MIVPRWHTIDYICPAGTCSTCWNSTCGWVDRVCWSRTHSFVRSLMLWPGLTTYASTAQAPSVARSLPTASLELLTTPPTRQRSRISVTRGLSPRKPSCRRVMLWRVALLPYNNTPHFATHPTLQHTTHETCPTTWGAVKTLLGPTRTDFFTSKLASKYQDKPRIFYPVLGFDQMIHGLCLYLTYINIDTFL